MKRITRIEIKLSKENLEKITKGLPFEQEFSGDVYTECVYIGHIVSSEYNGEQMSVSLRLPTGDYQTQQVAFKSNGFEPVIMFEDDDEVILFYCKTSLINNYETNKFKGYQIQHYLFFEEDLMALIYYYSFSNECELATILFTYITLFGNHWTEFSTHPSSKDKIDEMLKDKFEYYGIELSRDNQFDNPYLDELFNCFLEVFVGSKTKISFGHIRNKYVKCLDFEMNPLKILF